MTATFKVTIKANFSTIITLVGWLVELSRHW
jgi:hypothetical protein